jgi:hypothetical protein
MLLHLKKNQLVSEAFSVVTGVTTKISFKLQVWLEVRFFLGASEALLVTIDIVTKFFIVAGGVATVLFLLKINQSCENCSFFQDIRFEFFSGFF